MADPTSASQDMHRQQDAMATFAQLAAVHSTSAQQPRSHFANRDPSKLWTLVQAAATFDLPKV